MMLKCTSSSLGYLFMVQDCAIHGSPWSYDTFVPIFFAGYQVPHETVYREVGPHDIAATIAAYLDIKAPSGSVGTPLVEVLEPAFE